MTVLTPQSGTGPEGAFVELDGETFYRIDHAEAMAPFLMSIPSDTDLWMFIASTGGLTAGRGDPDHSLFPYDNVDRLYDAHHSVGPITRIRVRWGTQDVLWEPLTAPMPREGCTRRIYKNASGTRVIFEELRHDLDLAFRYRWSAADALGWVRTARLENLGARGVDAEVLDGLRHVLPSGVPLALHQQQSSLVDAYKRNECDAETGLAIYSLTSAITDRAEAVEALRATTIWQQGLPGPVLSVAEDAFAAFAQGRPVERTTLRTGTRGHYAAVAALRIPPGGAATWHLVADTGRGSAEVAGLRERLRSGALTGAAIEAALDASRDALTARVAAADGIQCTAHPTGPAHHFANVMFNIMRGGVFVSGYAAPRADVRDFLSAHAPALAARHREWIDALPDPVDVRALVEAARATAEPDLERLCLEYLPLTFGRRHGDPSRPWNRFSIRVRDANGDPALYYEGNWRDVFQNWEALAMSFPRYLPGMIAKFASASTVDGFNPYRITRDGVDWESVDPADPWSHIGYWGDHQTVYLLRLIEMLQRFDPGGLSELLVRPVFAYANVPYRLKPYLDMRADPRSTVRFDAALHAAILERERTHGTDARLVADAGGKVRHATLIEKLLVSALARLSNFVPDAGIWMNTQRPEWNDANNALAGYGVSVVTLGYLHRFLVFLDDRLRTSRRDSFEIAAAVADWANDIAEILRRHPPPPGEPAGDAMRATLMDALGAAFERYRTRAYAGEGAAPQTVAGDSLRALCRDALAHVRHALAMNRRSDGLFHAYHVLGERRGGKQPIAALPEMLEGQVAAISSGVLDPGEALRVVNALFDSALFDPGRGSFMLYPERTLPAFLERNVVPERRARAIPLLARLLAAGDRSLVALDASGACRFHPDLDRAARLEERLEWIAARPGWGEAVAADRAAVLDLYESVFRHRAFTGRSGAMYGYEGIGCIYWHMVAKLLLAVQEQVFAARDAHHRFVPEAQALAAAYARIRAGLGYERTPAEYGAFPTDPYSHTPRDGGARQPGMTGQVKEEILTRFGELGLRVRSGRVQFLPHLLLGRDEVLTAPTTMRGVDVTGAPYVLRLEAGMLAFTWCQVPFVYRPGQGAPWVRITRAGGATTMQAGFALGREDTRSLMDRTGEIVRIDFGFPSESLHG